MKTERRPYYFREKKFSQSNQNKGQLGESAFSSALSDFPILCNITYGKRQKDIDHIVLTCNCLVFNECKNTNENFQIHYSWFLSHVVDRFVEGLPVAQFYGETLGYSARAIKYTLTIPRLNTEPITEKAIEGLHINIIETKKQLLDKRDLRQWYFPVRRQILSVINTEQNTLNNSKRRLDTILKSVFSNFERRKSDSEGG